MFASVRICRLNLSNALYRIEFLAAIVHHHPHSPPGHRRDTNNIQDTNRWLDASNHPRLRRARRA